MNQTFADMRYGVHRLDTKFAVKIVCTETLPPLMWDGIPVVLHDLATITVDTKKRWKRRGRPDKVRFRTYQKPTLFVAGDKHPVIYMHPKLKYIMERT